MASAPASCGARDKAPPPWRSSTEASCEPEPGPTASTSVVDCRRRQFPGQQPLAGIGHRRAAGPCAARRCQPAAGPRSCPCRRCPVRAGAPPAPRRLRGRHNRSPRARRMICRGRARAPRESGGKFISRPTDVISSGTPAVHSCQPCRTSLACSAGNNRAPAKISGNGNRSNSRAVTTPKLPPPPRSAQNRSGSFSASTRSCSPPAVTTSIAVTRLQARPCLRA